MLGLPCSPPFCLHVRPGPGVHAFSQQPPRAAPSPRIGGLRSPVRCPLIPTYTRSGGVGPKLPNLRVQLGGLPGFRAIEVLGASLPRHLGGGLAQRFHHPPFTIVPVCSGGEGRAARWPLVAFQVSGMMLGEVVIMCAEWSGWSGRTQQQLRPPSSHRHSTHSYQSRLRLKRRAGRARPPWPLSYWLVGLVGVANLSLEAIWD